MKQNPLNQYSNISPQSIHIINLIPMNYKKIILALTVATSILAGHAQQKEPVDYVNPLMGTDSKISLHIGNNMRRQNYNAVFGKGADQIAETDALFRVKPCRWLV